MSSRSVVSRFVAALCFGFVAAVAATAQAQEVIPSEKVTRRVILREAATQRSADVGSFRPGERAELLEAGDDWHHVRLPGGDEGFVSAAWTVVVPTAWDVAARPPAGVEAQHRWRPSARRRHPRRAAAWPASSDAWCRSSDRRRK